MKDYINYTTLSTLIISLLISASSLAEIYRCQTSDGKTKFSDVPCKTDQKRAAYTPNDQLLGLWHRDLEQAFRKAKRENKHLFLSFDAKWCPHCRKMQAVTYQNQTVLNDLNNYIPVIIDVDDSPNIASRYQAGSHKTGGKGVPATIILDQQHRELFRNHGYINPNEMIRVLAAQR